MPQILEVIGAISQLTLSVAALLVAVIAHRLSKQASRIEAHRQIKEAFNVLNTIALSDPDNLRVLDEIETPQFKEQTLNEKRRRWLASIELNALESVYVARREGLLDSKYADSTLSALVPLLIQHEDICLQLQRAGYDPGFVEHCQDVRERFLADRNQKDAYPEASSGRLAPPA